MVLLGRLVDGDDVAVDGHMDIRPREIVIHRL